MYEGVDRGAQMPDKQQVILSVRAAIQEIQAELQSIETKDRYDLGREDDMMRRFYLGYRTGLARALALLEG